MRRKIGLLLSLSLAIPLAAAPPVKLISCVQAPQDSVGVWVRGGKFGIQGQWAYDSQPLGKDWCWRIENGHSVAPLPHYSTIEHVDPASLNVTIVDKDSHYFRWAPTPGGPYRAIPIKREQHHGSEYFHPYRVDQRSPRRRFEIQDKRLVQLELPSQRQLRSRDLEAQTLALQPGRGGQLAVACGKLVYLLDPADLRINSTLNPFPASVKDLAFDSTGRYLAVLTTSDQLYLYNLP